MTTDLFQIEVDIAAVALIPREMAHSQRLLAVGFEKGELLVATDDPLNYFALEEVRQITGREIQVLTVEESDLSRALAYYYAEAEARKATLAANRDFASFEQEPREVKDKDDGETPVVKLLDRLIQWAVSTRSSDIHIEPFERGTSVRMRIDGVILDYVTLEKSVHQPLIARIKILSNLDIAERRLPQDGHFRVRGEGQEYINLRVSILPTVFGEKAVLRLLPSSRQVEDHPEQFGMNEETYRRFLPMLSAPNGIIYLTGPTGSGKSTTLYMVLEYLSRRNVNICTIEDPVEKNISRVSQTQVNPAAGLPFESGLRAILRQDPDIIMVGETRDSETASISVRSAITGHIVLSTLHTNDAISGIIRLADMGIEPYLIANALTGIVAQRLLRKVCPHCAKDVEATEEERALFDGIQRVRRGEGCPRCSGSGYQGRIAIHEMVVIDRAIRRMIARGAEIEEIEAYARTQQGMKRLREQAVELVEKGVTTPEEALRITGAG